MLQRWLIDFYRLPGVASAYNVDDCKRGYLGRHGTNIVPSSTTHSDNDSAMTNIRWLSVKGGRAQYAASSYQWPVCWTAKHSYII